MTFGHFLIAMAAFAALGAIGHVVRAVVNLHPDRLSDRPWMDVAVSDGYSAQDHLLQLEFDDYGFYRLDSRRNLVVTVVLTMIGGFFLMALDVAASNRISEGITAVLAFLRDIALTRLSELGLR
jgi:hypothetical protein